MEAAVLPAPSTVPASDSCRAAASISRVQWLNSLKTGDIVLVRNHVHLHFRAPITDATPCYLHVGKLKFHRLSGAQTNRQRRKVYRMRLLLVRSDTEKVS